MAVPTMKNDPLEISSRLVRTMVLEAFHKDEESESMGQRQLQKAEVETAKENIALQPGLEEEDLEFFGDGEDKQILG